MKRNDDFETRREHLKDLSDAELETRFWSLIEELIDPLLKLGHENTTPAIERSVLLRMGLSSRGRMHGAQPHGTRRGKRRLSAFKKGRDGRSHRRSEADR